MPQPKRATETVPSVTRVRESSRTTTLEKLREFVETHRMKDKIGPHAFADFERELQERLLQAGRDIIAEEMTRLDIDADAVVIEGKVHRRVLRQKQTYQTSAGEVVVERTLYKDRTDADGRCVSPMELTLGVVGGFWTPRAAQQALWVVTQMTPQKSAELFKRAGNMTPSKSSLQRLPTIVADAWGANKEKFEQALREGLVIPEGTVSIAVSLDGVLAPIDGGHSPTEMRAQAAADGRMSKGPAGYREVGCATVSFCDDKGELLGAVRMARTPEAKKQTLKEMLAAEVSAIVAKRPDLKVVKVADAVPDNWEFLGSSKLPQGEEVIDFFHASEHLHAAVAAAYGDATRETQYRFETLRDTLREQDGGVEKVIRALKHLATKHAHSRIIQRALAYFRKHRGRMAYASIKARGLMIGSGIVEAACKTVVTQRLKQSGMRWSAAGAQAVLTPRGWDQSERFDEAWALVAASFQTEVTVLANVIAFKPQPTSKRKTASR
ncbi:MAG TPA: hypothetical protein VE935_03270 [Burkholderiales bacterium]|nr:hypothetical protein [Burkholderiales bacterium]